MRGGKKTLPDWRVSLVFLLANPEFHSHLASGYPHPCFLRLVSWMLQLTRVTPEEVEQPGELLALSRRGAFLQLLGDLLALSMEMDGVRWHVRVCVCGWRWSSYWTCYNSYF
jgi:hypothetical protein